MVTLKYGPDILVGLQVLGLEKDQKYIFGIHLHRVDGRCYWIYVSFKGRWLREEESQVKLGVAPHRGREEELERLGINQSHWRQEREFQNVWNSVEVDIMLWIK